MKSSNTVSSSSDRSLAAIQIMEATNLAIDPRHYHAFQKVSFVLFSSKKCVKCKKGLRSFSLWKKEGGGNDEDEERGSSGSREVVKCVSCGIFAHRGCSFNRNLDVCEVNRELVERVMMSTCEDQPGGGDCEERERNSTEANDDIVEDSLKDETSENEISTPNEGGMVWRESGPPSHWALARPDFLSGLTSTADTGVTSTSSSSSSIEIEEDDSAPSSSYQFGFIEQSITSVSKILQDNLFTHYLMRSSSNVSDDAPDQEQHEIQVDDDQSSKTMIQTEQAPIEASPVESESPPARPSAKQIAVSTYKIVKKTSQTRKSIPIATVAGGIAGGVAGLALAGPAGALLGSKVGQTLGVLGVLIEGSMQVGVLAAGITAGITVQEKVKDGKLKFLAIGDKKQVVLLRPNIEIDPEWDVIVAGVRNEAPGGKGLFFGGGKDDKGRDRQKRDEDIVGTNENEIPTSDKVLLLVSRSLNDKTSLPGHVYRGLIQEYRARVQKRSQQQQHGNSLERDESTKNAAEVQAENELISKQIQDQQKENSLEDVENTNNDNEVQAQNENIAQLRENAAAEVQAENGCTTQRNQENAYCSEYTENTNEENNENNNTVQLNEGSNDANSSECVNDTNDATEVQTGNDHLIEQKQDYVNSSKYAESTIDNLIEQAKNDNMAQQARIRLATNNSECDKNMSNDAEAQPNEELQETNSSGCADEANIDSRLHAEIEDNNQTGDTTTGSSFPRDRRMDIHAIIHHVTATLLEVRPGFGSSKALTEMSFTAVEGLVFGELYDSVFEEIVNETQEKDRALMKKIKLFEIKKKEAEDEECGLSNAALEVLHMLPEAHSAVDKLAYCIRFLELISVNFTNFQKSKDASAAAMSADSLLELVCQHIVHAKIEHLNAEIYFLEEFARDEQLLRGKEGYALVTMQAALHFLNASDDFGVDIFYGHIEGN